jgi:protein gp37
VIRKTPRHTYQILTKRAENLERLTRHLPWPENVWEPLINGVGRL